MTHAHNSFDRRHRGGHRDGRGRSRHLGGGQQHPGGAEDRRRGRRQCLAGDEVDGPFSAYCQADVIDQHTKNITGGLTYAELDREDPNRATAMDSAFLQASLFTLVVAFGVAFMAFGVGIVLALIGFGLRAPVPTRDAQGHHAAAG